jgi:hypothetical protein
MKESLSITGDLLMMLLSLCQKKEGRIMEGKENGREGGSLFRILLCSPFTLVLL